MCPNDISPSGFQSSCFKSQRGVSLVGAIFVVVMLAALGSYIATVTVFQHTGTVLSLQNARAKTAAIAGIEWGIWYVRTNNACPASDTSFTVGQFTVTQAQSECTSISIREGDTSYNLFELRFTASSTGSSFGAPEFASRTLRATVMGP